MRAEGSFTLPESVVAEAVHHSPSGFATGPERNLLAALLFDGIQAYMAFFLAKSAGAKAKYREAYAWIHRQDDDYVFSFKNVCEALGIDPDYLRYGVANALASKAYARGRSRRRF